MFIRPDKTYCRTVMEHLQYNSPTWPNWPKQNTPPNNSRIHILFKCTQNVCQDRSYSGPQINSQQMLKGFKSHRIGSFTTMELN